MFGKNNFSSFFGKGSMAHKILGGAKQIYNSLHENKLLKSLMSMLYGNNKKAIQQPSSPEAEVQPLEPAVPERIPERVLEKSKRDISPVRTSGGMSRETYLRQQSQMNLRPRRIPGQRVRDE